MWYKLDPADPSASTIRSLSDWFPESRERAMLALRMKTTTHPSAQNMLVFVLLNHDCFERCLRSFRTVSVQYMKISSPSKARILILFINIAAQSVFPTSKILDDCVKCIDVAVGSLLLDSTLRSIILVIVPSAACEDPV